MLYLRSIIFLIGMWIFTIPFTLASLLTFPFPAITRYKFISIWAKTMLYWLRISCNLNFVVKGEQNIGSTASIVLSKHQSAWETLAFQKIFPPQVWVLKKELLWVPFFGWGLAMTSPIAINRKAGRKSLEQILTQGFDRLKKGFWIVMFPEGTRTLPGQKGKYHIGGAWVASKTNTQVIPVAHNAGLFWPKNSILKKPGTIQVSIGEAIDVNNKEPDEIIESIRESFRKHVMDSVENVDGKAIYKRSGEILDFITFNSRDSYISTRFLSGGREVLSQAFRSGSLTPSSVMAEELEMAVGQ